MIRSLPIRWVTRVLLYILGLFFVALAQIILLNSGLGTLPGQSLPFVLSNIIPIDAGTCVIMVFSFYILLQAAILRRNFKLISLTQIIFSTTLGYFVNFVRVLVGGWTIPTYPGRLLMLGISIFVLAVGLILYIEVDLMPMPVEGLALILADKLGIRFHNAKILMDCLAVGAAILLSLLYLGELVYIREGTVITAILTGKAMALLKKPLLPIIRRLCFETGGGEGGKEADAGDAAGKSADAADTARAELEARV